MTNKADCSSSYEITRADLKFMERAMSLADMGVGYTSPNPMVGAVIVTDSDEYAKGYHKKCGGPHAEVEAYMDTEKRGIDCTGATVYVTLEPCSHYGKTPPCCELIIEKRAKRVVIGLKDPNPLVAGRGIKRLIESGIEVVCLEDLLSDSCLSNNGSCLSNDDSSLGNDDSCNKKKDSSSEMKPQGSYRSHSTLERKIHGPQQDGELLKEVKSLVKRLRIQNEIFLKYITEKIPFVLLKTAMSLDGKIATRTGDSKWITNEKSRAYVHRLRHKYSAICVGINTVIADDPLLNTRGVENPSDCIKVIVDSKGRIPLESKILNTSFDKGVIVATTDLIDEAKERALKEKGANVLKLRGNPGGGVSLKNLLERLGEMKIDSLMVEGGGGLAFGFIEEGLVDRVCSFIAPKIIGGRNALTPIEGEGFETISQAVELENIQITRFDEDIMIEGRLMDVHGTY